MDKCLRGGALETAGSRQGLAWMSAAAPGFQRPLCAGPLPGPVFHCVANRNSLGMCGDK